MKMKHWAPDDIQDLEDFFNDFNKLIEKHSENLDVRKLVTACMFKSMILTWRSLESEVQVLVLFDKMLDATYEKFKEEQNGEK